MTSERHERHAAETTFGHHPDGDLERLYRTHAGQLLGSLVRTFNDLTIAEDALHDAVALAIERWPLDGVPRQPAAWLLTVARRRALDGVRREVRRGDKQIRAARAATALAVVEPEPGEVDGARLADDQLRLIFTCCHPALAAEAQVALILRALCGLTTREIARAFLVDETTMSQRLVRAKRKIRVAGIPFTVPADERLGERIEVVLHTVYLVFNEGYSASAGEVLVRGELCAEAIRLGRLLVGLLPDDAEVIGLLALMLLADSRRETRADASGDVVLLADQDRGRWDHDQIDEGAALVEQALLLHRVGPYQLEAAIAALHATSPHPDATDWPQIVALYGVLMRVAPSPIVALNRAVAIAMADGPEAGLAALVAVAAVQPGGIEGSGLENRHVYHSTRAELLRRSGRPAAAAAAYARALELVASEPERRFLRARLDTLN